MSGSRICDPAKVIAPVHVSFTATYAATDKYCWMNTHTPRAPTQIPQVLHSHTASHRVEFTSSRLCPHLSHQDRLAATTKPRYPRRLCKSLARSPPLVVLASNARHVYAIEIPTHSPSLVHHSYCCYLDHQVTNTRSQCSGGQPCDACSTRSTSCEYDASSDQRRKLANQRNIQDLAQAQYDISRARELLGGMVAVFRAGDVLTCNQLVQAVRSGTSLSQLAAQVRNEARSNRAIEQAFHDLDFIIDGPSDLPSPRQLLAGIEERHERHESSEVSRTYEISPQDSGYVSNLVSGANSGYGSTDPSISR